MLFLLLACGSSATGDSGEPEDGCTLVEEDGTAECPVDACAAACASVEEGLACCVATHGYGESGSAVTDGSYCSADVTYDPGEFLTPEAALCAAQVQGFSPGIGSCQAVFGVCGETGSWLLVNTTREGCGFSEGEMLTVDATTGVADAAGSYNSDGECDE